LIPTRRLVFVDGSADSDKLVGGPAGSNNYADFSHRTDNLFLSNDGVDHGGVTIEPTVQNIFAGTGQDTVISTTAGSFLSAGFGHDSITSGGDNTILVAGPAGAGGDTVAPVGAANALYLLNGQEDRYIGSTTGDILQFDVGVDTVLSG
jgi:hypothetical protein